MPVPGDILEKDPDATLFFGMNWSENLPAGVAIVASEWAVEDPPDGTLELGYDDFSDFSTRVLVSGGTLGQRYRLRNRITFSGLPAQGDDRSFILRILDR